MNATTGAPAADVEELSMHWKRYNKGPVPLYWMRVSREVWDDIKPALGLHNGYWQRDGKDVKLTQVFEQDTTTEQKRQHLSEWVSFVDRESCLLLHGSSALWHPKIDPQDHSLLRQWAGDRLVEIEADTAAEALHQFRLTRWVLGHFYHCACMGNWREVIEEQLALAGKVGLRYMYAAVLGNDDDRAHFETRAAIHGVRVDVLYHHVNLSMFEIPTIRLVADFAVAHPENYVIYWHTKGVSAPNDWLKTKWRRLMNDEVVGQWRRNVEYLKHGIETVGVNWRHHPPTSHWPGNYWLSTCRYLKSLQDFSQYYRNPRHHAGQHINQWRLAAEFWHGSGHPTPRIKSLVSFNERIDQVEYWNKRRGASE